MTAFTHTDYALHGSVKSYPDHQDDGLLLVTVWSVVGMALAALTIWLGLGGSIESLIGLG